MAIKDSEHRKRAAAKEAGRGEEAADLEIEGKVAETKRDSDKIIKEIDPAPKRLKPKENPTASGIRYEGVQAQEKHQVFEERTMIFINIQMLGIDLTEKENKIWVDVGERLAAGLSIRHLALQYYIQYRENLQQVRRS